MFDAAGGCGGFFGVEAELVGEEAFEKAVAALDFVGDRHAGFGEDDGIVLSVNDVPFAGEELEGARDGRHLDLEAQGDVAGMGVTVAGDECADGFEVVLEAGGDGGGGWLGAGIHGRENAAFGAERRANSEEGGGLGIDFREGRG